MNEPKYAGPSIREQMWEELDSLINILMAHKAKDVVYARGRAYGVASCLAILEQPYSPNVDAVRERAMERWNERRARLRTA